jgi:hypothetical protein
MVHTYFGFFPSLAAHPTVGEQNKLPFQKNGQMGERAGSVVLP